jgi:hypothetical protein
MANMQKEIISSDVWKVQCKNSSFHFDQTKTLLPQAILLIVQYINIYKLPPLKQLCLLKPNFAGMIFGRSSFHLNLAKNMTIMSNSCL